MAIRSIAQLKAWFKRGKYPTESQFSDWIDSFFHKEEDKIPISSVDKLPEQLNGKYPDSDGKELEKKHEKLSKDFASHTVAADIEFDNIHTNLEELEADDEKIWADITTMHQDVADLQAVGGEICEEIVILNNTDKTLQSSLTNAHNDIGTIREMMKGGATLADAKAALVALGASYQDLYAVAGTLKVFLEAADTADTTINAWAEIEMFLQGITDTQSLTALLNDLEARITTAYTAAINANIRDYIHPDSHPATMIAEDNKHRFVTDAEKVAWNDGSPSGAAGGCLAGTYPNPKLKPRGITGADIALETVAATNLSRQASWMVSNLNTSSLPADSYIEELLQYNSLAGRFASNTYTVSSNSTIMMRMLFAEQDYPHIGYLVFINNRSSDGSITFTGGSPMGNNIIKKVPAGRAAIMQFMPMSSGFFVITGWFIYENDQL